MSNHRSCTNLRLVKCPKCAKILPEPVQVPVYACGGCNTILQAKNYKATRLSLHGQDAVQNNGIGHASDGGESDGSGRRSSSSGQQSLVENETRVQNAVVRCTSSQIETANSAQRSSSSDESTFFDSEDNGETEAKTDLFDQRGHRQLGAAISANSSFHTGYLAVEHCHQKEIADLISAGETSMRESEVFQDAEWEQLGTENGSEEDEDGKLGLSDGISSDDHELVREANYSREASILHESLGIQNKELLKFSTENGEVRVNNNEKEANDFVECISARLEGIKLGEAPLPTDINRGGDEDSTVRLEVGGSNIVSAPPKAIDLGTTVEVSSTKVSQVPQRESSSLDNVVETPREKMNIGDCSAEYVSENLKSTEPANTVSHSLKVNSTKSPTKGSFACEESVSSFDGNDDQVLRPQGHVIEENGLPSGKKMRPNRHGFPPRVPPLYWSSEVPYETGSSSSYVHNELPHYQTHHHPYKYEKSETWLRKTHTQRGTVGRRRRFSEAAWTKNECLPMYCSYETSGEIYQRSRYNHGYTHRKRRSESWSQSGSLPRMPYSGEVLNGRNQIPDPYVHQHRYPDDLRWSAQLPPHGVCCHQGLCIGPSREISWDPYESYPTSPRHLMEPNYSYPWAQDMIFLSDDPRYKDHIMRRLHLREKRQAVKRHLQPVAGGSPFITCYFCFRVLHLPGDFLLPGRRRRKRRTHMLKCSACSNILEFSLDNECSLATCVANNASEEAQSGVSKNDNLLPGKMLSDDSFGGSGREKGKPDSRNEERRENTEDREGGGSSVQQGRQVKVTWELPARTKSPLHRLMGYSSPRDLLNGSDEDVEK